MTANTDNLPDAELLASIDVLLGGQDELVMLPMTKVNQAVASLAQKNGKLVARLTDKILQTVDAGLVEGDNQVDAMATRVLAGLDTWQFDTHTLLEQLATKAGFKQADEPLEAALIDNVLRAPELTLEGAFVLEVKELRVALGQVVVVLREIRDAINGAPQPVADAPRDYDAEVAEADQSQFLESPPWQADTDSSTI